ncbi:DNA-binding response regulator [[Actinomadura] parvosata subsp. kistnae]|uniref:DNA-binding response regulator n=1 Tax=[Actinomadura] parvosata subsp. kistnae TaxID=1909395 RepID=A0A1V0ALP2_9ACTN|nr:response regulator transcription factor [Nonomuraea sp. ATCC 55076]AQZ71144.1 DNA-binding response regulator [Nonomuraea sp. ATCC 55076]
MRVAIAEDSVLLREGITRILEAGGIEVVAAVGDAEELIAAVERFSPDVVVVDVRMPPTNTTEGLRAALKLRRERPEIAVLVLSQFVEERYATDLLSGDMSGVGYLLKDRVVDVKGFLRAVRQVADGGTVLDPEVVSQVLARHRDPLKGLTPRELEVLGQMAQGRSNAGIAAALVVSESAVAKHVNNIFAKLGLAPTDTDHRRVIAVIRFLQSSGTAHP